MSEDSQLDTQAQFLVRVHGPRVQQRLLKELREAGANANSPSVKRTKELLRRVTELLAPKAA
jgi:hypothetical protein